ncbi:MAG TPA: trigger factor [bacterium]|nr:trigger factor [bacterium]
MIEVKTNKVDAENVELEIIVPAELVDKALSKTYQRISSKQTFPGFRPGKVPKDIIKRAFGAEGVAAQALQDLLPDVYEDALEQADVVPIADPDFDPFPTLVEGEPMDVKVKLQVLPEFEVSNYDSIPVNLKREIVVDGKDIDEGIENLRKRMAEFVPLIEDRGSEVSDRVTLDYEIKFLEGEDEGAVDSKKDLVVIIGDEQLLPDIEKNIMGMKIGDNKEFEIEYPENYQNENLAGKKTKIKIDVKKIDRQELPEIDDDFLKKAGDFKDLDALREDMKRNIRNYKHSAHEQEIGAEMVKKILDSTNFEVPRKLVMDEIDSRFEYLESMLEHQGMDLEDWAQRQGKTVDDMRDEEYHDARMSVKRRIVFNQVFTVEGMQLMPNEIEMALLQYAQRNGMNTSQLKKMARNRNFLMQIRSEVREQKVMRFLRSRVRFVDDPVIEEEPEVEEAVEVESAEPAVEEKQEAPAEEKKAEKEEKKAAPKKKKVAKKAAAKKDDETGKQKEEESGKEEK